MFKRLSCGAAALGLVLALGVPARAAGDTGSIRVTVQNGETLAPDGTVYLYQVAVPMDGDFRLREAYGGGVIKGSDALSPVLARWLAEMAGEDGRNSPLEAGTALFDGLPEGLYLLKQWEPSTGYQLMEPMLVMLPCEFQWNVSAYPIANEIVYPLPATGQSPLPLLGAAGMLLSGSGLMVCLVQNRRQRRRRFAGCG